VLPSIESVRSGDYPIARKLYLYTVGEVSPQVREFLEWTMSQKGQAIVAQEGYVPVK
jgi:phosphate transport system substrate-binding protein